MKGVKFVGGLTVVGFLMSGVGACSSKGGAAHGVSEDDATVEGSIASMPVVAEKIVTASGDTVVVADPSKGGDVVALKATELIDDLKLLKLDNSEEALIRPGQTWIFAKRIIAYDGTTIKQFDHSGKYLGQIGAKGNGPGEYTIAPYDVYVNEDAGCIFLAQYSAKSLITYDLDGKFIRNIPLSAPLNKGFVGFDPSSQVLTLAALQFKDASDTPYEVWTQDLQGNVKSSIKIPWLETDFDYSNEVFSSVGSNPSDFDYSVFNMMNPRPDSLYHYKDDRLAPAFTVDFGGDIPMHQYTSTPKFFEFVTFGDAEKVSETSFVVRQNVSFIVDRKSLRGGYAYLDLDGVAPIELKSGWLFGKTPDYFSYCIEPGTLVDMLQEVVDSKDNSKGKREAANKLLATISPDDDNCYIFFGRWKR